MNYQCYPCPCPACLVRRIAAVVFGQRAPSKAKLQEATAMQGCHTWRISLSGTIIGMKWHEHQQKKIGSIITIHPKCLNNPSFIFMYTDDFPSYKPPFIGNSAPKLRTTRRWMPSKDTGCIGGRSFKLLNIQPRKNDSKGLVTLSGKPVIEIWYYPLVN